MLKNLFVVFSAAILVAGVGHANAATAKVVVQTPRTAPTNGKQMYSYYCASCHGVDGKGIGPASVALKTQPADLTVLSKSNGGKFPATHVVSVLQFGAENAAHGSAEMPVWGPVLGQMNKTTPQERALRISNISRYLETLQVR
ncbi:MAG: c-type cytochrome [Terracidiphilus sp.]